MCPHLFASGRVALAVSSMAHRAFGLVVGRGVGRSRNAPQRYAHCNRRRQKETNSLSSACSTFIPPVIEYSKLKINLHTCNVRSDTPASLPGNVPYKKVDQSRGTNTSRRWCRPPQKMDRTDLACLASRWGIPVLPRRRQRAYASHVWSHRRSLIVVTVKLLIAVFHFRHEFGSQLVFENHYSFMRAAYGLGIIHRCVCPGQKEFVRTGCEGRIAKWPAGDVSLSGGEGIISVDVSLLPRMEVEPGTGNVHELTGPAPPVVISAIATCAPRRCNQVE